MFGELVQACEAEWSALLARLNASNLLFQAPEWHRVLSRAYGFNVERWVMFDAQGKNPVAAIAVCTVETPGERKVVSLPFSDYAGPVGLSVDSMQTVVHAVRDRYPGMPFVARLCSADSPISDADGQTVREGYVHRIDLTQSEERLWLNLTEAFRRAVRKAIKSGVTVRFAQGADAFMRYWELHAQLRRDKFFEIPQPRRFFRIIAEEFNAMDRCGVAEAWYSGRYVAGILYLIVGNRVHYKFAASSASDLDVRPNNLLLWETMLEFKHRQMWDYDLGLTGSDPAYEGLRRYKSGSGAHEYPLRFVRFDISDLPDTASQRAWKTHLQVLTRTIARDRAIGLDSLDALSEVIYPYLV